MKRSILALVGAVLLWAVPALAGTTYFIDSVGGSDGNDGTSSGTAWQSLTPVQSALNSGVAAGSQFLFKKGDTWTWAGSCGVPMIQIPTGTQGTAGSPIVFGTYGSGAAPIFNGNSCASDGFRWEGHGTPGVAYITINGFEVDNCIYEGIYFHNYSNPTACSELGAGIPGILIENNMLNHNGPGAFPGATVGPNPANVGSFGPQYCCIAVGTTNGIDQCGHSYSGPAITAGPCDDSTTWRNGIMFSDEHGTVSGMCNTGVPDGVRILGNTVSNNGGHDAVVVQGDSGAPQVNNNTVFQGVHELINFFTVVGAVANGNTVYTSNNSSNAMAAFLLESDGNSGDVTITNNVVYEAPGSTAPLAGVDCAGVDPTRTAICNVYNNTFYVPHGVGIQAPVANSTLNVQNNIIDSSSLLYCGSTFGSDPTFCPYINKWDYNNDGGVSGGAPSGLSWQGAHDQSNVDPRYVSLPSRDFRLNAGSADIKAGIGGLPSNNNNIGYYAGPGVSTPNRHTDCDPDTN